MSILWVIIIAIASIIGGYLIGDYQAYDNINNVINVQNAVLSGKAWGLFQVTAGSATTTATV